MQSDSGKKNRRVRPRRTRLATMGHKVSEVLDVAGAAGFLGVSPGTVYQLAREGKVPGMKVGREWRFARQTLLTWLASGTQAEQLTAVFSKVKPR